MTHDRFVNAAGIRGLSSLARETARETAAFATDHDVENFRLGAGAPRGHFFFGQILRAGRSAFRAGHTR
jgi:hypothetical protein